MHVSRLMLKDKKILLGVCGSIAAYKAALLIRLLVKAGADVKVIMTPGSVNFITPLTLSTLSKNPVLTDYFQVRTGEWNNHVDLALWADFIVIAPASANTIAKFAVGVCDNLLSAVYLSAKSKVYIAPAMDLDMWVHPATQANIEKLISYGNIIINPASGELASGLIGEGRLAEPEDIVQFLISDISKALPLLGKRALVTAGPTYEAIDPVRFVGNYSSGKMGFAIAEELANKGAEVTLISGPASEQPPLNLKLISITSTDEMLEAVERNFVKSDIIVMSAAVADYKPKKEALEKIKKVDTEFSLELTKTPDILTLLGEKKSSKQILIGFALETENEEENAIKKLNRKNLDFIVLNSLRDKDAGFKSDYNKITIINRDLTKESFALKTKKEVAVDICRKIFQLLK